MAIYLWGVAYLLTYQGPRMSLTCIIFIVQFASCVLHALLHAIVCVTYMLCVNLLCRDQRGRHGGCCNTTSRAGHVDQVLGLLLAQPHVDGVSLPSLFLCFPVFSSFFYASTTRLASWPKVNPSLAQLRSVQYSSGQSSGQRPNLKSCLINYTTIR